MTSRTRKTPQLEARMSRVLITLVMGLVVLPTTTAAFGSFSTTSTSSSTTTPLTVRTALSDSILESLQTKIAYQQQHSKNRQNPTQALAMAGVRSAASVALGVSLRSAQRGINHFFFHAKPDNWSVGTTTSVLQSANSNNNFNINNNRELNPFYNPADLFFAQDSNTKNTNKKNQKINQENYWFATMDRKNKPGMVMQKQARLFQSPTEQYQESLHRKKMTWKEQLEPYNTTGSNESSGGNGGDKNFTHHHQEPEKKEEDVLVADTKEVQEEVSSVQETTNLEEQLLEKNKIQSQQQQQQETKDNNELTKAWKPTTPVETNPMKMTTRTTVTPAASAASKETSAPATTKINQPNNANKSKSNSDMSTTVSYLEQLPGKTPDTTDHASQKDTITTTITPPFKEPGSPTWPPPVITNQEESGSNGDDEESSNENEKVHLVPKSTSFLANVTCQQVNNDESTSTTTRVLQSVPDYTKADTTTSSLLQQQQQQQTNSEAIKVQNQPTFTTTVMGKDKKPYLSIFSNQQQPANNDAATKVRGGMVFWKTRSSSSNQAYLDTLSGHKWVHQRSFSPNAQKYSVSKTMMNSAILDNSYLGTIGSKQRMIPSGPTALNRASLYLEGIEDAMKESFSVVESRKSAVVIAAQDTTEKTTPLRVSEEGPDPLLGPRKEEALHEASADSRDMSTSYLERMEGRQGRGGKTNARPPLYIPNKSNFSNIKERADSYLAWLTTKNVKASSSGPSESSYLEGFFRENESLVEHSLHGPDEDGSLGAKLVVQGDKDSAEAPSSSKAVDSAAKPGHQGSTNDRLNANEKQVQKANFAYVPDKARFSTAIANDGSYLTGIRGKLGALGMDAYPQKTKSEASPRIVWSEPSLGLPRPDEEGFADKKYVVDRKAIPSDETSSQSMYPFVSYNPATFPVIGQSYLDQLCDSDRQSLVVSSYAPGSGWCKTRKTKRCADPSTQASRKERKSAEKSGIASPSSRTADTRSSFSSADNTTDLVMPKKTEKKEGVRLVPVESETNKDAPVSDRVSLKDSPKQKPPREEVSARAKSLVNKHPSDSLINETAFPTSVLNETTLSGGDNLDELENKETILRDISKEILSKLSLKGSKKKVLISLTDDIVSNIRAKSSKIGMSNKVKSSEDEHLHDKPGSTKLHSEAEPAKKEKIPPGIKKEVLSELSTNTPLPNGDYWIPHLDILPGFGRRGPWGMYDPRKFGLGGMDGSLEKAEKQQSASVVKRNDRSAKSKTTSISPRIRQTSATRSNATLVEANTTIDSVKMQSKDNTTVASAVDEFVTLAEKLKERQKKRAARLTAKGSTSHNPMLMSMQTPAKPIVGLPSKQGREDTPSSTEKNTDSVDDPVSDKSSDSQVNTQQETKLPKPPLTQRPLVTISSTEKIADSVEPPVSDKSSDFQVNMQQETKPPLTQRPLVTISGDDEKGFVNVKTVPSPSKKKVPAAKASQEKKKSPKVIQANFKRVSSDNRDSTKARAGSKKLAVSTQKQKSKAAKPGTAIEFEEELDEAAAVMGSLWPSIMDGMPVTTLKEVISGDMTLGGDTNAPKP